MTSVLALVGLGFQQPALAKPTTPSGKPAVEQVCGAAKKGEFTCYALKRTDVAGAKGVQPLADAPSGFGPADLLSAYNLPANGGAGQTVAIVDAYDNPNAESDLAVYRQQYGLPPCTTANGCFRKVDQRGGTSYPSPDSGWAGEIALDLDMVSAVAPNAHILLVEGDDASFDSLGSSVNTAVELGAKYVSNSYGTGYTSTPGSGEDADELTYEEQYYNHPGVAITVSSGDSDYGVAFPAASQYVTSVGGTSLVKDNSARGWHESVWHNSYGGPGSGCSVYEPKPSFQHDTGCDKRAVADVSAVSDPVTGVAVYNSYQASGWAQYGGTSAASPIIAGVYASAGTPVAGSYPNTYPYANAGSLNDVTEGANGSCSPAYLCTAGTGYDGPTGLGTPNGLAAFRSGPHGQVSGTVTDAATGATIDGATVKVGDNQATSGTDGTYTLTVPPGTYDVTVSAYGYSDKTVGGVSVADGGAVTTDVALTAVPTHTVTGKVTDGSGHGWPLGASITVDGVPGGPVHTDPYTGKYSVDLPEGHDYTLHVTSSIAGYAAADEHVSLGTSDATRNVALRADANTCTAPGYTTTYDGTYQAFDAATAPDGWTVTNATDGGGWQFTDDGKRGNLTGGSGNFAIVDSDHLGTGKTQDTTLTTPVTDLSTQDSPAVGFDSYYHGYSNQVGDVDYTVDGGATWTNVWHKSGSGTTSGHQELLLSGAAHQSAVQVRFHFTGKYGYYWELDNVFLGNKSCTPVHGGLVEGRVVDANTGGGVKSATVTSGDKPAESASTVTDAGAGEGYYWMFSSVTGSHPFSAAKAAYATATSTVNVATDDVTRADFTLKAGQITLDTSSVSKTLGWGTTGSGTVTLTNTGGLAATVKLGEQQGGFQMQAANAPVNRVDAKTSPLSHHDSNGTLVKAKGAAPSDAAPTDDTWSPIANLPTAIQDNAVSYYNGTLYSAFGYTGSADSKDLYAFDPSTGAWSKLASAADTREGNPAHGFINGKLYAVGGWGASGAPDTKLEIYDPASNSWSTGTAAPKAYAGAGSAVLDGKLYSVGGCTSTCGVSDVLVYDASSDSWSQAASYPEPTAWESCGALGGKLYCAGGVNTSGKHAYVYDPGADSWSPVADLPIDLWGGAYTVANGKLLVSGGVTNGNATLTNQGLAYDPGSDSWSALPNNTQTVYRAGGALGFYVVGGNPGGSFTPPIDAAEVLAGYDQGGSSDVSWLGENATEFTLAPGASKKVTLSLDAADPAISQPGDYTAAIGVQTNTPYQVKAVGVTMHVNPPKTWGKVAGTIKGLDAKGNAAPLAGATVQIDSWATSYTLKTGKDGSFALWLDVRNNPLTIIIAKDGYQPQVKTVKVVKGQVVVVDTTLKKA
ncbi:carboxypeptidase regulatory-like domain-containing protein [Actinocatenispora rupis]|uniref:carboxypeptidase regulatory-like domain-containing protein n=1 Tax=Actinocatenispora rupis TaxID=519421 RepID=UPI001EF2B99B|nr:carboxypeptidase regulatory-like domain-containing protein [Actinocatenispora rupis]